jgi:hypothetical protein
VGGVWARCGCGVGGVWARCGRGVGIWCAGEVRVRGAGAVRGRCGGGAGAGCGRGVHFLSFSSFSSFFLSRSSGFFDFLRSFHTCTRAHTENAISSGAGASQHAQPIPKPSWGMDPLVYVSE